MNAIYLYSDIAVFSILMIILIIIHSWTFGGSRALRLLTCSQVFAILTILADHFFSLWANHAASAPWALFMSGKIIYFMSCTLMGWYLLQYFEEQRNTELSKNRKKQLIWGIPLILQFLLELINLKTGMLYMYNAAANVYTRGPLFILQYLVAYCYVVTAVIRGIRAALSEHNYIDKSSILLMSVIPVIPAAAGIIQYWYWQIPVLDSALVLVTLIIYFDNINGIVSQDPMTGLNNKKVLMKTISARMKNADSDRKMYLIMIDIDHFKEINDKYGHTEGDRALMLIVQSMKHTSANMKYRAMIARYGGDEFSILGYADTEADVAEYLYQLDAAVARDIKAQQLNYELSVSLGCAVYEPSIQTVNEFVKAADDHLYTMKSVHHTD